MVSHIPKKFLVLLFFEWERVGHDDSYLPISPVSVSKSLNKIRQPILFI